MTWTHKFSLTFLSIFLPKKIENRKHRKTLFQKKKTLPKTWSNRKRVYRTQSQTILPSKSPHPFRHVTQQLFSIFTLFMISRIVHFCISVLGFYFSWLCWFYFIFFGYSFLWVWSNDFDHWRCGMCVRWVGVRGFGGSCVGRIVCGSVYTERDGQPLIWAKTLQLRMSKPISLIHKLSPP